VERRLRALAAGSRSQAFRVELAESIASVLIGPGARRLLELEALTKKRFFLDGKPQTHLDHFVLLAEGKLVDLAPPAPVGEDSEIMLQLVEVDRYDGAAAVGKLDGLDVVVADAASLVGKRLKVRVERVLDGRVYAVLMRKTKDVPEPLTAEGEADKPTRKPPARKPPARAVEKPKPDAVAEPEVAEPQAEETSETEETPEPQAEETREAEEAPKPKKKTRRGSRGGRKRKKTAATPEAEAAAVQEPEAGGASEESPEPPREVTIHVPGDDLGREGSVEPVAEETPAETETAAGEATEEAPKPKKKTRRGSRGGRRRKKPAAASQNGAEVIAEPEEALEAEGEPEPEPSSENGDFDYVPMSEWLDEIESGR
jgi:hypothetical protein